MMVTHLLMPSTLPVMQTLAGTSTLRTKEIQAFQQYLNKVR